jgi:hypothetical protein
LPTAKNESTSLELGAVKSRVWNIQPEKAWLGRLKVGVLWVSLPRVTSQCCWVSPLKPNCWEAAQ